MDFWRIVEILEKRKWLILLSAIVGTLLMAGATRLIGSRWVATVDFVTPARMSVNPVAGQPSVEPVTPEESRNQAVLFGAIVKSQAVLEPVLRSMDQSQLPPDLLKSVDMESVGPNMYQLQVTDQSSARATQLANAMGNQLIKVYHNINTQQADKAVQLLSSQLRSTDVELDRARQRYDAYRSKHKIIGNLSGSVNMAITGLRQAMQRRDSAVVQTLDMSARLSSLQALAARIPALKQSEVMGSGPYTQEQADLAKAEDNLADLRSRYTDAMPRVQAALAARDAIAKRLQTQWASDGKVLAHDQNSSLVAVENEIRTLKQSLAGAQAQVNALNIEVGQGQADLRSFQGVDLPLSMLGGEVAEKSEERNSLAQRLNTARQALDIAERQSPITMMDRVNEFNPPVNTSGGRTVKLILFAALGTLICACTLVIVLDGVDRRVKTVRQAEIALPRGILAAIPQPRNESEYSEMARVTELSPHSMYSEAYRFLGLHLLTGPGKRIRSLMVLAAKAAQGSTTTLTNLAITLAQAGKSVVVIDANIRTAEIHTVFGVPNGFGFTDVLKEPTAASVNRALQASSVNRLSFMTSGSLPDNPWELFRSDNLTELSRLLLLRADYVLYDTPSSLMFTDALNLAPVVDAALLCVRAFEPLTGAEERLVTQLEGQDVSVLGSVLSDLPPSVLESYPNLEHYYGRSLDSGPVIAVPVAG